MTKYRFKEGLEFEGTGYLTFASRGPNLVGLVDDDGHDFLVQRDQLEEVVPELSESEKLPNGTAVRATVVEGNAGLVAVKRGGSWRLDNGAMSDRWPWIDAGRYVILTPEVKPAAGPRVFRKGDMEPGPEVTHVKDDDGDVWTRQGGRWTSRIEVGHTRTWDDATERSRPIIDYAPLTDVSADYA